MSISKDLVALIKNSDEKKTKAYDTPATVTRVEGSTIWVHIPGGVDETPVRKTINAKAGDTVQVRVGGGSAWLVGNQSAPPTDDARAIVAERKAVVAETKATEAKEESAEAIVQATEARYDAIDAVIKANGSVASDTLHYLATSASSGVTIDTQGWTTTIQYIDSQKRYLWTYHTYTKANGSTVNTQPVITGTYGVDGTSVTILGSYDTVAELEAAHPTGQLGDAYMVAGDLYVWNGTAWENVGQIQGPKGDTGATGPQGPKGDTGATGAKGDTGTSVTSVTNWYLASPANTGITRDSPGWTTTIQTMTATNQYLWNYEVVKGTGNVTLNTTNPIIIGRYGQNGQNGISITAVQPQYYLSTSSTSATGGSWGNTLNYESGKYIWTRDAITYSNNTTGYSTAIYNSALTSACVNAANALQIAEDTNQYFWHAESGTDTGAHITEIPQEDFIEDPQNGGSNLLARSNGIAVRDGLTELATFGANGSQIGVTGESHLEMDYRSINLVDKQNETYFYVSDLRDKNTGTYQVKESFVAIENQTTFWVDVNIYQIVSVKVDNVVLASTEYTYTTGQLLFELITPPQEGATVEVIYTTNSPLAKAYTLGTRKSANQVGACSFVEGYNNAASKSCSHAEGRENVASGSYSHAEGRDVIASGYASHAEGTRTVASGNHSHAEGYETTAKGYYSHAGGRGTIAKAYGQTVIGNYNIESSDYSVIVGNGTDDDNRSNALTVKWNGDLTVSRHSSPIGSFYSDNATTAALTANIDAYKSGASITLDAGTYVVYCYGSMGTNSSAAQLRAIRLYRVTPDAAGLWSWRNVYPNGNWATISATLPIKLTQETTLRVDASASVAANGASTWIIAVRIA